MSAKPFRAAGLSGKFSGSGMGGVYEAAELSRFVALKFEPENVS
jgi:hypothetical protein